ncbi:hypothetical protein IV203_006992 [Nitzschia inconspicua]|uniref:Tyr recombinase domain-containing protein n=1 Tax=Nitzschia inconspicua TaxID=303405 RepID=A0A9K3KE01_9STRA|nr:hypothetical protein IV203_006992 [Nitzschia inconspicua]
MSNKKCGLRNLRRPTRLTIGICLVLSIDNVFSFHAVSLSSSPGSHSRNVGSDLFLRSVQTERSVTPHNQTQNGILETLEAQGLSERNRKRIIENLERVGLWEDHSSSEELILLAQDFVDRPEVFSTLLISDFDFPPLVAHQTRALAMSLVRGKQNLETSLNSELNTQSETPKDDDELHPALSGVKGSSETLPEIVKGIKSTTTLIPGPQRYTNREFVSTVVNERQRKRMNTADNFEYGLSKNYAETYPQLALEIEDRFYKFMTQPSTYSQEDPIRPSTAKIYLRHAKLFLGWCIDHLESNDLKEMPKFQDTSTVSVNQIIPNKEKESANIIIDFVLWLRSRDVSLSYEANLLRGIIKLLKFRFAKESQSDPLDGKNTFDDIPIIREVRKLHRDANKRQKLAPRSSDEQKKWISWKEYLYVIESAKNELLLLIEEYQRQEPISELPPFKKKIAEGKRRRIADAYVRYLILAIFSSIPDRQRTIRELEIGRTLIKDTSTGFWTIKHGPEDYKTGKHYGERPAIQLAEELTPAIDDFIENWRPALAPSTNFLLVQGRTGKPLTADSIFQRVVRSCFNYTGKRVNPHLLRDIIVTHVRETNASEKELEALALFMGHSIQMQRTSYDRRTLSSKIAPAVKLMESMNSRGG